MVKKNKKTVLKISTGHKPLPYRNGKNSKTKVFAKGDAQLKKSWDQTHIFSLSFNGERSILPSNNSN